MARRHTHARQRSEERYRMPLTVQECFEIVEMIRESYVREDHRVEYLASQDKGKTAWAIWFRGMRLIVVVNVTQGALVTVLPPGAEERLRNNEVERTRLTAPAPVSPAISARS